MMILAQGIVNKLSIGAVSSDIVRVCAPGGGKSSSIAGFWLCNILCHSERMRRIAILWQYCPVGLEFQPNTFTPVIASESEAIYCIKKITSSGENSAVEFLTSTFAPPRNDEITPSLEYIYPGGAAA